MRYSLPAALSAVLSAALVAGCSARTDVSLTGNTPAQYSHLRITTQELWFNGSATAGPDDPGWTKFRLKSAVTLDLVQNAGGTLGSIATNLSLPPGSYSQVRLIPVDSSASLTSSAASAGALYNAEAVYVDAAGTHHQPLELLNPDQGIGVVASLRVPIRAGNLGTTVAAPGVPGTSSTASSTSSTPATTSTSSSSSTTTPTAFTLSLDGARDLVPFTYGGSAGGILLSSHASAYDLTGVGGISGTLTLSGLTNIASVSGLPDIEATAEILSADGTRHVALLSTPVHADGTFLLYPLPSSSSTPATYDVVIHGAGIATIIVKAVAVMLTATSTTSSSTGSTVTSTPTSATATNPSSTNNTVSVGTLIPRAATRYLANITTSAASPLAADAQVGFYQTLSASGELPYQIAAAPIDPFNQVLAGAQALSTGTLDSGTYVASGAAIALFSAAPKQGAGGYVVAASAPSFADGPLTPMVAAPSSITTTPVIVTVPGLSVASGGSLGSVLATVTQASPGKYDQGELLVAHDGTLVGRVALNGILAAGGTVAAAVPSGTTASLYYVSVRVWNSRAPASTLQRQWFPAVVNLTRGGNGSIAVTIN